MVWSMDFSFPDLHVCSDLNMSVFEEQNRRFSKVGPPDANVLAKHFNLAYVCNLSSDQNRGCLLYIGNFTTHYIGIIISQYKDPYQPISLMECHKGFERCSLGFLLNSLVDGCDDDDNGMVAL